MGVEVTWANENKTAFLTTLDGKWTWDEIHAVMTTIQTMAQTVDHTVHLIADIRQSGPIPAGVPITQARNVLQLRPPNAGLVIVVTKTTFFQTLVEAFNKMFSGGTRSRLHIVADLDEAFQLIEREGPNTA